MNFKVYPESGHRNPARAARFYRVIIFNSREAMYAYSREVDRIHGNPITANNFRAICKSWIGYNMNGKRGRPRRSESCGEVLLEAGHIGGGLVSHEMTHAALHYFRLHLNKAMALLEDKSHEERLCWIQGNLVRQFWNQFYSKRIQKRLAILQGKC